MPYKVESKMFSASEYQNGPDIQRYLNDREKSGWDLVSVVPYYGHAFVTFIFKKRPVCVGKHNGPIVMDDDD